MENIKRNVKFIKKKTLWKLTCEHITIIYEMIRSHTSIRTSEEFKVNRIGLHVISVFSVQSVLNALTGLNELRIKNFKNLIDIKVCFPVKKSHFIL